MVARTSKEALASLGRKEISTRRELVFRSIEKLGVACDLDVEKYTKMKINTVTARRNELMHDGLIEKAYEAKNPETGVRVIYWKVRKSGESLSSLVSGVPVEGKRGCECEGVTNWGKLPIMRKTATHGKRGKTKDLFRRAGREEDPHKEAV